MPLKREPMGDTELAVFPYGGRPHVSGALIRHAECEPAIQGSVVYLSVENLDTVLKRVQQHGGDTIMPRTEIPGDMGFFAQFRDSGRQSRRPLVGGLSDEAMLAWRVSVLSASPASSIRCGATTAVILARLA